MSARHQKSNIRKQDIEHNFLINFPSHSKSIFGKLCKNPNSEILELQNNCQDQKRSKCSKHIFWEMFKQANIVAMHILCACIPRKIRHEDICDRCLHWPSVLYWPQKRTSSSNVYWSENHLTRNQKKKTEKSEPIFDKKLCSNWIPAARFDIKNDLLLLEKFPKNLQVM